MATNAQQARAKAAVYAEVLLQAAQSSGTVFEVAGEFDELVAAVRGSIELRTTLTEPALPLETKAAIVAEVFKDLAPELVATFKVMVERDDLAVLARANEVYTTLAEAALGVTIIDVTTVVPLNEALREQIIAKYSAQLGTGVRLREHLDTSLVGGVVLSTHGKRIDASVSSQLENARLALSKA